MDGLLIWLVAGIAASLAASWYFAPLPWAKLLLISSRKLAGLREKVVHVDGIRWHYLEGGEGPLLLLVHGFGGDADHWLMLASKLRKHFRILAPDLPGFGTSSTGRELAFDVNSQADRLARFLDVLDVAPQFIAGSSMGGWISSSFAARRTNELQTLWLLGPLGTARSKKSPVLEAIERKESSPINISSPGEFRELVIKPMFSNSPPIPHPLLALYGKRAAKRSEFANQQFQQVIASPDSLEQFTASLDMPVLLQWGENDQAVDVSGAKSLAESSASLQTVIQRNMGHLPMIEAPAESAEIFLKFCHEHNFLPDK